MSEIAPPAGRTYIETLILQTLQTFLHGKMKYHRYIITLADLLEEEVFAESLRNPNVRQMYINYLKDTFEQFYGDLVLELPDEFKESPHEVMKRVLQKHARELFSESLDKVGLEEEIELRVARIRLIAAKALFRELGKIR